LAKFTVVCLECGRTHAALALRCENGCNSLLRTQYAAKSFRPGAAANLFRFLDWLPCTDGLETTVGPVIHRCERFGRRLGLARLFCCFNGYWPEIGARNPTCTFKDFEALPTLRAFADAGRRRIVVASAGNTARAFAHAAAAAEVDVDVVVPEGMLHRLWLPASQPVDRVRVIAVKGSNDYNAAIQMADEIARRYAIATEGGARNVARRDGLGTVMLEAARVLGRLPRHYFQAVGSGTGAIAAFEAALRLAGDRRFAGAAMPRLHLSQSSPFLPIHQAWRDRTAIDPAASWERPGEEVYASVLANRNPPYALRGGVRDALAASGGDVYAVSAGSAHEAGRDFAEAEGIDLDPAAAVAAASLAQAVAAGAVAAGDLVLLNVTGGGFERLRRDYGLRQLAADLVLEPGEVESAAALTALCATA
jgi:cysteate synthase